MLLRYFNKFSQKHFNLPRCLVARAERGLVFVQRDGNLLQRSLIKGKVERGHSLYSKTGKILTSHIVEGSLFQVLILSSMTFALFVEFFHNYQNTKLTDLAITSYLVFRLLNVLQSLINLVEYTTQTSN